MVSTCSVGHVFLPLCLFTGDTFPELGPAWETDSDGKGTSPVMGVG
jgi:hypothetical protein